MIFSLQNTEPSVLMFPISIIAQTSAVWFDDRGNFDKIDNFLYIFFFGFFWSYFVAGGHYR